MHYTTSEKSPVPWPVKLHALLCRQLVNYRLIYIFKEELGWEGEGGVGEVGRIKGEKKCIFPFLFIALTGIFLPQFKLLIFLSTKQASFPLIFISGCKVICRKPTSRRGKRLWPILNPSNTYTHCSSRSQTFFVLSRLVMSYSLQTPLDCSPPSSSVHADSPSKNTRVGCYVLPSGDLPNPGKEPRSPALQADSLPSEPPGKQTSVRGNKFHTSRSAHLGSLTH